MKKFLCYILIFMFMITTAGCAAGQGNVTGTDADTEEEPAVGARPGLVTFSLNAPNSETLRKAYALAADLGGELLHCGSSSSEAIIDKTTTVNFSVTEAKEGDNIVVYQLENDKWEQLTVVAVTDRHVAVNISKRGILAFIRLAPPSVGSGSPYLNYNGFSVSALGYAELDGDQIYSPFLLEEPDYTLNYDAKRVVAGMSGDIIAVFTISSPGVTFNTAKVTFKVSGIKNGDRLYVFSKAGGSWNRVEASVVGDKHVLVTLYGNGPLLFFKRNSL